MKNLPSGNFSIAAEGTPINYLLPESIGILLKKYPKLYPKLYVMLSDDTENFVSNGEIDIGVISRPPLNDNLRFVKARKIPHIIIASPQPEKDWHELSYVIPRFFKNKALKKSIQKSVDGWLEEEFPRKVAAEVETIETTLALCEAGVGAAFVPDVCAANKIRTGSLAIVSKAPFEYYDEIYIIWHREKSSYPSFQKIIQEIKHCLS